MSTGASMLLLPPSDDRAVERPQEKMGWWTAAKRAAWLSVLCAVFASSLFSVYVMAKVQPVVPDIYHVIGKSETVFDLLYRYMCTKAHILSEADCELLRTG